MNILKSTVYLLVFFCISSCSQNDGNPDEPVISNEAKLTRIDIEYNGSTFKTKINGNAISLARPLPFGTEKVTIKTILLSPDATSDKKVGDELMVIEGSISIMVTAQDELAKETYALTLDVSEYASPVEKHGHLQVSGNKIVNTNNESISLAGNSFFWSNDTWGGNRFYNASVVSWLKLDWETTIIRAAMGVEDYGGYLDNKTTNKNRIITLVDAAIAEGVYVIIDWHSHHAEDNTQEAVLFFAEMASLYGEYDNVIYEIYNEPLDISWTSTIKPYADSVIAAIREHDPDNMIVVGTPEWSQRVDLAAQFPITNDPNIAYGLHFYSINHQQWLRDRADAALESGIALFITEWGPIGYTQNDPETEKWMEWCLANEISHCAWAVNDKEEEWSIVIPGTNTSGGWADNELTESGKLEKRIIRDWPR